MWHSSASYTSPYKIEMETSVNSLHTNLSGTKCHLLQCIAEPDQTEAPVLYDCKILDGAVTVHALPIINVSKFQEYADNVFIPQLRDTKRVDIVWDEYRPDSLKEGPGRNEAKVCVEKYQVTPSCRATGMTSSVIQSTRRNLLNSCHQKLRIAASLLSVRYISQLESMLHVLERRSKCTAAIRKKQSLGLWFM